MNSFFLGIKILRLYKAGSIRTLDDETIRQWQAILLRSLKRPKISPRLRASPSAIQHVCTNAFRIISAERAFRNPDLSPYKPAEMAVPSEDT